MFSSRFHIWFAVLSCCSLIEIHGRAVNISGTWFLPQEKFPVFYRFFQEKITWDEARSSCDSHSGNLISLDNSDKLDVLRAYLKELDVLGYIWIGLKKEISENRFSWINGESILGDGNWLQPVPKSEIRLCTALDPASDYRWVSSHCGGPETAAYVCEIKVPDWANREDGCMITELPSLSITLEPEMGVIELISDCGLAGTRRIVCKGRTNREEVIKQLSCDEDLFSDRSTLKMVSTGTAKTTARETVAPTTKGWSWISTERQTRHRRSVSPTSSSRGFDSSILNSTKV